MLPRPQPGPPLPHSTGGSRQHQHQRLGCLPSHFPALPRAQHHSCLRLHQEHSLLSSDRGIFNFLKPISCQHWLLNILCPLALWRLGDMLAETFLPVIMMKRRLLDGWVNLGGRGRGSGEEGRTSLSYSLLRAHVHTATQERRRKKCAWSHGACVMVLDQVPMLL